eukprot:TRINITY_DN111399_c0_g1_i1.p1 TRINITY_DN111399_c0_g1~~TRINITY_DN111399_c0_g1_i1.p1  ORF type:complete len:502 (+),score=64.04 TRINITY_DN111399_c0_g1_i1:73-1578(+)
MVEALTQKMEEVHITITMMGSGTVAELSVPRAERVVDIKFRLAAVLTIPPMDQRLVQDTQMLDDTCKAEDLLSDSGTSVLITLVRVQTGHLALSAEENGQLHLWDLDDAKRLSSLKVDEKITRVDVDWPSHRVMCGHKNGTLALWDLTFQKELNSINEKFPMPNFDVNWVTHRAVVSSSNPGHHDGIFLWDIETGRLECLVDESASGCFKMHWPSGQLIVGARNSGSISLLEIHGPTNIWHTPSGHTDPISRIMLNWELQYAFSLSHDETVRLWDVKGGTLVHSLHGHKAHVCALSSDTVSRRAVSGDRKGVFILWDLESGQAIGCFGDYGNGVFGLQVDWSSGHAFSGTFKGKIHLWSLELAQPLQICSDASDEVEAANQKALEVQESLSNDAETEAWMTLLVARRAAEDASRRLAQVLDHARIQSLTGHSRSVSRLFLGDGFLISSGRDGKIILRKLPSEEIVGGADEERSPWSQLESFRLDDAGYGDSVVSLVVKGEV